MSTSKLNKGEKTMSDSDPMSPEAKEEWFVVKFLNLPKASKGVEIEEQMKLIVDAQDRINKAAYMNLPLPSDELALRLIEMAKGADATILWHLFYWYDTRHNLGFRERFLRG